MIPLVYLLSFRGSCQFQPCLQRYMQLHFPAIFYSLQSFMWLHSLSLCIDLSISVSLSLFFLPTLLNPLHHDFSTPMLHFLSSSRFFFLFPFTYTIPHSLYFFLSVEIFLKDFFMIFLISLPSFRSFFISSFVVIPTYSFLLKPFLLIFFIPSFTLFPPYCTFFVSVFYLYLPLSRTPFLHFLKTASCFTFLYYTSFSYISYPSLFHF